MRYIIYQIIISTASKALQLVAENEMQKRFFTEKQFLKSTSSETPHVVIVPQNGSIKRDKS